VERHVGGAVVRGPAGVSSRAMSELSDLELLSAWRSGDSQAGNTLCKRHVDALYRFFRTKVSSGAEDLVQHTLTAAVEARDRFAGQSSFKSYLFGIARNLLRAEFRRRMKWERDPDFSGQSLEDCDPSPSTALREAQQRSLLTRAMRRIPVDFQIALELYYWENLTGPELAEILGLGEPGVRSRLRRAKEALRDAMDNLGASDEDSLASLRQLEGVPAGKPA